MATWRRRLGDKQRQAVSDAELFDDQVDPRRLFGHGVFDLQAGIDLEEGDRTVNADQEFHRAGAGIAGGGTDALGRIMDLLPLGI